MRATIFWLSAKANAATSSKRPSSNYHVSLPVTILSYLPSPALCVCLYFWHRTHTKLFQSHTSPFRHNRVNYSFLLFCCLCTLFKRFCFTTLNLIWENYFQKIRKKIVRHTICARDVLIVLLWHSTFCYYAIIPLSLFTRHIFSYFPFRFSFFSLSHIVWIIPYLLFHFFSLFFFSHIMPLYHN